MATVERYELKDGSHRYMVRYRTPDNKQTKKRGFTRKIDAQNFLATVQVSKLKGEYVAPTAGRATLGELGQAWISGRENTLKPSTWRSLDSAWRIHVEPRWAATPVGAVEQSAVQEWINELSSSYSATTTLRAHGILAGILDTAVSDRRVSRNVARGLSLPKKGSKPRAYLTHAQVDQLAAASLHPTLVFFLAYTGLRWGEATALRVSHLNMLRRRVQVTENAVLVGNVIHVGTPKTYEARSVPFPKFLTEPLARLCEGKPRDGLIFTETGSHMRLPNSVAGWFAGAVHRCRQDDEQFPRVTPHDLRHTAASLAISAGANVKAVQRMLGHSSAAVTLDVYADLFDDDLDGVAEALHLARQQM